VGTRGNLLQALVLLRALIYACRDLFVHHISMTYLNPRLSYYYFPFMKRDVRHIGILLLVPNLTYLSLWVWHFALAY